MRKLYEIVGLGGTFDRFHAGHKHFIKFASQFGQHLHIGITHPKLTQGKPFSSLIEPYNARKRAVIRYCKSQQISCSTIELTNPYGPTLDKKSKIRALVVTPDTASGADLINQARAAMDLRQLPTHICPLLKDKTGQVINSTKIRAGKINRSGEVYQQIFAKQIILNNQQRQFFSQPQGELVTAPNQSELKTAPLTCVVGDHSLEKFIHQQWHYDLAFYDLKEQRQPTVSSTLVSLKPDLKIKNDPGTITPELALTWHDHHLIFIDGEEDLATVALVLTLPLNSKIYYGQPHQGLIEITVTEEKKGQFFDQLKSMS